ncbi:uncharacterized protein K444DRAFT_624739 [Hyaloscypha bicolor E]|uniref:Uncharacterized protein n=1 Tax=Hyaloscypha bicolor E TaxID=1095630 RepID=A0A2J6TTB0_9HELO|nr:uncharacterized protein K444DRAFT_624739 [Hyaloscypha bicolor E]PMD66243.1 hypothetical protein K444DRAFT_624739 [Hyaloscypha bicolor E]
MLEFSMNYSTLNFLVSTDWHLNRTHVGIAYHGTGKWGLSAVVDLRMDASINVRPILHLRATLRTPISLKEAASDPSKPEVLSNPMRNVPSDVDLAIPELQTLGDGPNGTGRDTDALKLKCDHDGQVLNQAELILEGEMVWGDKAVRCVDFQYMKKDWNDENEKDEDGKWCARRTSWRVRHIKGFVSSLRAANGESATEIVAVGHGSFFRKSIGESRGGEWEATQWRSFSFDENGN